MIALLARVITLLMPMVVMTIMVILVTRNVATLGAQSLCQLAIPEYDGQDVLAAQVLEDLLGPEDYAELNRIMFERQALAEARERCRTEGRRD